MFWALNDSQATEQLSAAICSSELHQELSIEQQWDMLYAATSPSLHDAEQICCQVQVSPVAVAG